MAVIVAMRKPWGLTLVELLATIAIIGLLVGILLPAVQSARESARRVSCANKIGQLSKACLLYANAKGAYPAAFTSKKFANMVPELAYAGFCGGGTITDFSNDQSASWTIVILPFLEHTVCHGEAFIMFCRCRLHAACCRDRLWSKQGTDSALR